MTRVRPNNSDRYFILAWLEKNVKPDFEKDFEKKFLTRFKKYFKIIWNLNFDSGPEMTGRSCDIHTAQIFLPKEEFHSSTHLKKGG